MPNEMRQVWLKKCVGKPGFFMEETFSLSTREQFLCQVDALGEASIKNGMTHEWNEYQPKFKKHFDAWKQCDQAGGIIKKLLYVLPLQCTDFGQR